MDRQFNIASYGAAGDGRSPATKAVQAALDAAAEGGGCVVVPPGVWCIGSITLRGRTKMYLAPGAVLAGSRRLEDYPQVCPPHGDRTGRHLINVHDVEDVTICGQGTIDGAGEAFWLAPTQPGTWLRHDENKRPSPMLDVRNSRGVQIEGVRFRNAPGWTMQFHECDGVWVHGIEIDNPLFGPNTDGIDISGSVDVCISDCRISCGDDAVVAFPSFERDCERVVVSNCIIRTNCAAFKAYLFPGRKVRDLAFTASTVYQTNRAVALYAVQPGLIENVVVGHITCDTDGPMTFNRPVHIDARRGERADGPGTIRNVQISNMACRTDGRILLTAADGAIVQNVLLRDVRMTYPVVDDPVPYGASGHGSQASLHSPEARVAPAALVADGLRGLVVDNLMLDWPDAQVPGDASGDAAAAWFNRRRAGNGTFDLFPPPPPPENASAFAAIWARGIRGGYARLPLARASRDGVAAVHCEDCQWPVDGG